jgi:hypothetical protein
MKDTRGMAMSEWLKNLARALIARSPRFEPTTDLDRDRALAQIHLQNDLAEMTRDSLKAPELDSHTAVKAAASPVKPQGTPAPVRPSSSSIVQAALARRQAALARREAAAREAQAFSSASVPSVDVASEPGTQKSASRIIRTRPLD